MRNAALCLCIWVLAACGGGSESEATDPSAAVVEQYLRLMFANASDVVDSLQTLQDSVQSFVADPSDSGLKEAQRAWLDARPSYGQLEVGRFYNGPVDEVNGGANEWPIDENFIDYTAGNSQGGIINDVKTYPQINTTVLVNNDEIGGIENLSTGYHAIEFLLWGQRRDQSEGPGERPYTDYADGGTASNQGRRREYLVAASELLLSDLTQVRDELDMDRKHSYAAEMRAAPPHEGLARIVRGLTSMAISELYYERMTDPYLTQNRKDEESCFSESTHVDLVANMLGVENVYLGRYGALEGPSLSGLIHPKDATLDADLRAQMTAVRAAIDAIPAPFDHAVISPEGSSPREAVKDALDKFVPLVQSLQRMAALLEIKVNI